MFKYIGNLELKGTIEGKEVEVSFPVTISSKLEIANRHKQDVFLNTSALHMHGEVQNLKEVKEKT